ncbi:MAG TPA: ferrous iron transport protein B [Kineosporiaceae bacterium]
MRTASGTKAPARPAVPSCHGGGGGDVVRDGKPVVALVGSPNVGKSSLFNAVTGARRSVGNWAGTSVEVGTGSWRAAELDAVVVDLPGAYGLDPLSPDEELTRDLLVRPDPAELPDVVVVVVSAADLARTLYLAVQVLEQPLRVVLAVTMADVAARRGIEVDAVALGAALGDVPVVPVDPRRGRIAGLAEAVGGALAGPAARWPLPAGSGDGDAGPDTETPDADLGKDADPGDDADLAAADLEEDVDLAAADRRFTLVAAATAAATRRTGSRRTDWSDRVDRVVTSPVVGPLVFLLVMWAVFHLTTRVAAPVQGALDTLVSGPVSGGVRALLGTVGLGRTWVEGLLVDGVIAGVGMLLTFVPVMAVMFALLAVLEDSGYLARAAVVTDRLMRAVGLPGRAFLPLVVGFGCNVPGVSATRVLPNARQRLLTVLLVPFTSCSARLTVYVLVASSFFGRHAGDVIFGMYVLSIVLVVLAGLLLRSTLLRALGTEDLVLDLPRYQLPMPRLLLAVTWMRLSAFLRTAGGVIVATVVVVWALSAVQLGGDRSGDRVQNSAYGALAATAAPVFAPAGFGDWHATGALVVGFVAKEAVVSSWAQTYATDQPGDVARPGRLGESLRADFARSSGGHVTPAVLAFLVFLLGYTPCAATLAAQRREIGTRWTLVGLGTQLTLAWTLAVCVFQIGRLLT